MLGSFSATHGTHKRNGAMGMEEKTRHSLLHDEKTISRERLLVYPDFLCLFKIHTDASDYQLGAVISQHNKLIVFYSPKLNATQTRYTTMEK